MKTIEQILEFITNRIGHVYYRPLMYGGSAAGVDLILYDLHEIWAEALDRRGELRRALTKYCNGTSTNFSTRYRAKHPKAAEHEVAAFVVEQWGKVSDHLGVPIDRVGIRRELELAGLKSTIGDPASDSSPPRKDF